MSLLLSLLKAAAGEISSQTALGRWMRGVSQVLDSSNINGPPRYVQARRSSNLIGFNPVVGQILSLANGVLAQNGIPYDGASGAFTLPPGRWLLHMSATLTTFSDATGGFMQLNWADADDTGIGYGATGTFAPLTSTTAEAPNPNVDAIVELTETTRVGLLVSGLSGAGLTMSLPQGGLDITITELR